jgi:hypothetical protein
VTTPVLGFCGLDAVVETGLGLGMHENAAAARGSITFSVSRGLCMHPRKISWKLSRLERQAARKEGEEKCGDDTSRLDWASACTKMRRRLAARSPFLCRGRERSSFNVAMYASPEDLLEVVEAREASCSKGGRGEVR